MVVVRVYSPGAKLLNSYFPFALVFTITSSPEREFNASTSTSGIASSSPPNTSSLFISQYNLPDREAGSTSKSILRSEAVCLIACSSVIIMFSFLIKTLFEVLNTFSISSSGAPIETTKERFPAGTKTLYLPYSSVVVVA